MVQSGDPALTQQGLAKLKSFHAVVDSDRIVNAYQLEKVPAVASDWPTCIGC